MRRAAWIGLGALLAAPAAAAPAGTAPERGELVFSELALDVATGSYCQWFEMVNAAGRDLDLSTCRLCAQAADGSTDPKCFDFGDSTALDYEQEPVVPADRGPSSPALFAYDTPSCYDAVPGGTPEENRRNCVAWSEDGSTCLASPTLFYKKARVSTGSAQLLCLLCGGAGSETCLDPGDAVVVDELSVYWNDPDDAGADIGAACDEELYPGGCAVQALAYDADANDAVRLDGGLWNLPLGDEDCTHWVPSDTRGEDDTAVPERDWLPALGSPGWANCTAEGQAPAEGELAFTEVMADPAPYSSTEWLELTSAVSGERDLNGCTLAVYKRAADTGESWELATSTLLASPSLVAVPGGGSLVLAVDQCLFPQDGELPEAGPGSFCPGGEFVVDLSGLSASATYRVELSCPAGEGGTVLVDAFTFSAEGQGGDDGQSLMFCGGAEGAAEANDLPENWCPASVIDDRIEALSDAAYQELAVEQGWVDEPGDYRNYGTPGELGECHACAPEPGRGCRLRCGPSTPASGLLGLLALGLAALRRRREA